ncbi:outer membrane protein [Desulfosediminicola ganghwensis]|uniref:outer membrane protein n=1 Tax=Desulfosediminicola ganghwensis TaxID=2569540 RepID=UPI0010AD0A3A|nr:outer membrane beta-barrel protein [Desulfosediminicola ganghwensis]
MKKFFVGACIGGLLINFAVSDAEAAKLYVSGHLGAAFADDSDWDLPAGVPFSYVIGYDTGWSGLAAVGYEFEKIRLEAEIGYQNNGLDSLNVVAFGDGSDGPDVPDGSIPLTGDLNLLTMMVNGYYSFDNSSKFTPYISAGFGFAYVELKDLYAETMDEDQSKLNFYDTVFAYQFGAGVEYGISEQLFLDLRYRYFATSDIALDFGRSDTVDMEFASHNLYAGVRYLF